MEIVDTPLDTVTMRRVEVLYSNGASDSILVRTEDSLVIESNEITVRIASTGEEIYLNRQYIAAIRISMVAVERPHPPAKSRVQDTRLPLRTSLDSLRVEPQSPF